MNQQLKQGETVQLNNKTWTITQVSEDNEGQTVYHLKSGNDVSVLKQSDVPKDLGAIKHQR